VCQERAATGARLLTSPCLVRAERARPLALACLLLAACTPAAPRETVAVAPTAGASATPAFAARAEAHLAEGRTVGEWLVVGLAHAPSDQNLAAPQLLVVLRDASGAEIGRQTVDIAADPLPAGAAWPFEEPFRPSRAPRAVEVRLVGNPGPAAASSLVRASVLRSFLDAEGATILLGRLADSGGGAAIESVRLLGRDESGRATAVVSAIPAVAFLAPRESAPFLARAPRLANGATWQAFVIARPAEQPAALLQVETVSAHEDDQGNPFVSLFVRNDSPQPVWAQVTAVASLGEAWMAAAALELPTPLAPGARLPLALRLPRTSVERDGAPAPADLAWQIFTASRPASASAVSLPLEVVGYEAVGSTLLLRIRVEGIAAGLVDRPSVIVALRGSDGELLGAGLTAGDTSLADGASLVLTVAIPIARGLDLRQTEFDVLAVGVPGG